MQTFLPYPDFGKCASVLDNKRLGKQRVECLQIMNSLGGLSRGWINHPAVKMWKGHHWALMEYGTSICKEWIQRGYKDTCAEKLYLSAMHISLPGSISSMPEWLGSNEFHLSHRSNLLRKFPEHYKKYWPDLRDDIPYVWPK